MIYLDNASSTLMDSDVKKSFIDALNIDGNPSSVHKVGRNAKMHIEDARREIADRLAIKASQIFFTSGATEAINLIVYSALKARPDANIISSHLEHEAMVKSIKTLSNNTNRVVHYVSHHKNMEIDYQQLELLMQDNPKAIVAIMHVNNESGDVNDIDKIGEMVKKNDGIFISDMVQSFGHIAFDLKTLPIHYTCCSGHKIHGPKGMGLVYINDALLSPMIQGGGQEMNIRAGTENVPGIIALKDAFLKNIDNQQDIDYILALKLNFLKYLKSKIPAIQVIGDVNKQIPHIVNILFPMDIESEMLVFNLDINGVCASAGSACSSGSLKSSKITANLLTEEHRPHIRFSFSKYNTQEEIKQVCNILYDIYLQYPLN